MTHVARLAIHLAALIAAAISLRAQTTEGRILGTVTDTTQAVVAGARVTITNLGTNRSREIITGEDGNYAVGNLPVGSYQVAVEMQGFKKFVQRPVVLTVDQTARVDAALQPGDVAESVTVEGSAPLIESERSAIGQVVDNRTIVELPLNGRNFIRLGSLIPGTTRGAPGSGTLRSRQGGEALTANGQRAEYNNYMLDGVDNNEINLGLAVILPSIDALQEFKVQTSNYSAEFGRGAGAIVNVVMKSGSNQLHGTAYEFLRNDVLDARNTFAPSKNPLRRNQFGFTVGGPVLLPKIYDGRNRSFFFFNYEGLRERRGTTGGYVVPTAAQRAGNFAGQPTVYDPSTLDASGARVPFAGNMIPSNRISAIAPRVLESLPLPNNSDPARNYIEQLGNPTDGNQFHIRADHNLTVKDLLMVRLSYSNLDEVSPGIAYGGQIQRNRPRGGVIGYTRTFSPTLINELRFGTHRYSFDLLPDGLGTDLVRPLGLPVFNAPDAILRYPSVTIRNFTGLGGNQAIPVFRAENTYQWIDNASWYLGRHTLKFGGDMRWFQFNNFQPQTASGSYTFNGPFTGVRGSQYTNGLPDLLLGLPSQQSILNAAGYHPQYLRNFRFNLFIQDDFQVSQKLTLNIGVRWERDGSWREKYNRWAYFDYATGQTVYPRNAAIDFTNFPYPFRFDDISDMTQADNKAFAPRFGFAYRPFGGSSTVIRSAYGVFWGQSVGNPIGNTAGTPPPYFLRQTITSGTTSPELQWGVFPNSSPSQLLPTIPSFFTHNPFQFRNGYVQQWNFGIEKQLLQDLALKASYVGNKGTGLELRFEGNAALPPGPGAVQNRRLFPLFGSIQKTENGSNSTYHSLQLTAEKRYSKGLQLLAGYTWSKALDNASSWGGLGSENFLVQDPLNRALDKGRSAHDLRQRFTLSYVWDLPVKTSSRIANVLIAGWQSSGIVTLQTGFPFTVLAGGDIPNTGAAGANTRANVIGNPYVENPTIDRWFNTSAFALPPAFTYGTAGRNILDGPGSKAFDLTMMKNFSFTESQRVQFRAEFFNAFNNPTYGLPNAQVGNSAIGTIRSASNREMQFGLKYIF